MDIAFDISQDEIPIFLAETEDHLQVLEEGLVSLERQEEDPELLQALFRAAHTIKGSAGMIGHKRLVEVTHALETAFDGVRKHTQPITTPLIDACLQAVDGLRLLRDEVINQQACAVDVATLVAAFSRIKTGEPTAASVKAANPAAAEPEKKPDGAITVSAAISPNSIASAARAFQLMLAIQGAGQVLSMEPTQEQIESAAPVAHFKATFIPSQAIEAIRKDLEAISEVDHITIEGKESAPASENKLAQAKPAETVAAVEPAVPAATDPASQAQPAADGGEQLPKLGEYLIKQGLITQMQLQEALQQQRQIGSATMMIGEILVKTGAISQTKLDHALSEYNKQRSNIMAVQGSEAEKAKTQNTSEKTVRTSVERLDRLMNLVGELITDRNRLYQIRHKLEAADRGNEQVSALSDAVMHIGRLTDQLQEEVMHIRMLPVANVFNKFPRLVRDLSQKTGKDVELIIRGQETELDRSVIEEINDPIIHLLRNSIDHGIESPADRVAAGKPARGTVILSARHEQGHIIITVEDDGRGIDSEKLKASAVQKGLFNEAEAAMLDEERAIDLIFLSGLSTSEKVTDLSGRGVGMDIVRNNIERLNGSIFVDTKRGQGTQFQISLPLTLAIVPTLLVKVSGITFAIPLVTVVETQRLADTDIQTIRGKPATLLRNQVLSLINLAEIFGLETSNEKHKFSFTVVVRSSKLQVGLIVDALVGEEEVVVKSLGSLIGEIPGISSAAILGDGQIALIADVKALFKLAGLHV